MLTGIVSWWNQNRKMKSIEMYEKFVRTIPYVSVIIKTCKTSKLAWNITFKKFNNADFTSFSYILHINAGNVWIFLKKNSSPLRYHQTAWNLNLKYNKNWQIWISLHFDPYHTLIIKKKGQKFVKSITFPPNHSSINYSLHITYANIKQKSRKRKTHCPQLAVGLQQKRWLVVKAAPRRSFNSHAGVLHVSRDEPAAPIFLCRSSDIIGLTYTPTLGLFYQSSQVPLFFIADNNIWNYRWPVYLRTMLAGFF